MERSYWNLFWETGDPMLYLMEKQERQGRKSAEDETDF